MEKKVKNEKEREGVVPTKSFMFKRKHAVQIPCKGMFDVTDSGIDATIELDDTQSQCSSETVESGFSAQVYCTLLIVI